MDLTGDKGVLKTVLQKGEFPVFWTKGCNATCHYIAYSLKPDCCHTKHLIVDTREKNRPFDLRIGMGFQVEFMELAITSLKLKEKARFIVQPAYLKEYSTMERVLRDGGMVRQCCATAATNHHHEDILNRVEEYPLEIEIELIKVENPGEFLKQPWEMSLEERYKEMPLCKELGIQAVKQQNYAAAVKHFERALVMAESLVISREFTDIEWEITRKNGDLTLVPLDTMTVDAPFPLNPKCVYDHLQTCRLNHVHCQLKLKEFSSAITVCHEILKRNPHCVKAYLRRSQAYTHTKDLEKAQLDLDKAKALMEKDPSWQSETSTIHALQNALNAQWKLHHETEKKMYKNIFR